LWPQLKVKYLVYTTDAELLEKCLKRVYKEQINPNGHEIIEGIKLEEVIEQTNKHLEMFNIYNEEKMYKKEENIEKYNENSMTHTKKVKSIKKINKEIEKKEEIIKDIEEKIEEKQVDIILNTIVFRIIIFLNKIFNLKK
jgi:hypothetical protein